MDTEDDGDAFNRDRTCRCDRRRQDDEGGARDARRALRCQQEDNEQADLLAETGTGASYDMEDPVGLGKALESLLGSSSDHAAMSARARAVFDERFDAGRVYADYADHLAAVGLTRRVS